MDDFVERANSFFPASHMEWLLGLFGSMKSILHHHFRLSFSETKTSMFLELISTSAIHNRPPNIHTFILEDAKKYKGAQIGSADETHYLRDI